jgi:hypothetical protein
MSTETIADPRLSDKTLPQEATPGASRRMKANRLPAPDVAMSRKTLGWRVSTLRAHGVNLAL